jgi:hypothetical protein
VFIDKEEEGGKMCWELKAMFKDTLGGSFGFAKGL